MRVIEFAIIEKDVRVGIRRDRERALANAGADERPRLALPVPEADPRWRRSCGDQIGVPEALQARAIAVRNRSCVGLGRRGDRVRGPRAAGGRDYDPAAAAALLDGAADTPAGARLVEVSTTEPFLLELADSHAGRVEHEDRERVLTRHEPQNRLDLTALGGVGSFRS
jgi:hypothetical protein